MTCRAVLWLTRFASIAKASALLFAVVVDEFSIEVPPSLKLKNVRPIILTVPAIRGPAVTVKFEHEADVRAVKRTPSILLGDETAKSNKGRKRKDDGAGSAADANVDLWSRLATRGLLATAKAEAQEAKAASKAARGAEVAVAAADGSELVQGCENLKGAQHLLK